MDKVNNKLRNQVLIFFYIKSMFNSGKRLIIPFMFQFQPRAFESRKDGPAPHLIIINHEDTGLDNNEVYEETD